jgi:hypothetical protein
MKPSEHRAIVSGESDEPHDKESTKPDKNNKCFIFNFLISFMYGMRSLKANEEQQQHNKQPSII